MKKRYAFLWRGLFYGIGAVSLAVGLTLNTKTQLGVGSVASIAYSGSLVWDMDYGRLTFAVYMVAILLQLLLKQENRNWKICLQLPFSAIFSALLTAFGRFIRFSPEAMWQRFALLFAAVGFTALGLLLMVDMKLVANPADALADTVGSLLGGDVGFGKNVIDIISVALSCGIGLVFAGEIVGIGIGTVVTMLLTGRLVSLFRRLLEQKIQTLAGIITTNKN